MLNNLYTITENGINKHYIAKGELGIFTAAISLHSAEMVAKKMKEPPSMTAILESLDCKNMYTPDLPKEKKLLQPLAEAKFAVEVTKMTSGQSHDAHIIIDFDSNYFDVSYEYKREPAQIILPLDAFISMSQEAVHLKSSQKGYYVDIEYLKELLRQYHRGSLKTQASEVENRPSADETQEPEAPEFQIK